MSVILVLKNLAGSAESTLRVCPMSFDDIGAGVLGDAEVASDPAIVPPVSNSLEHLQKPVPLRSGRSLQGTMVP